VTLKVVAESRKNRATPLAYVWKHKGVVIENQTAGSLVLSNVSTGGAGAYSVTVSIPGDPQAASATSTATLSVLASAPKPTTAGSDGVSVHTAWWVYWVKATNADGEVRNGYYALERELNSETGIVTPQRAVWVWEPDVSSSSYPADAWSAADQAVLDAVASERSEFSVLAFRSSPSGNYAISGRVEEQGDGSLYGAPDLAEGAYTLDGEDFTVELTWDMEQVYSMDTVLGATPELKLQNVKAALEQALQEALDNLD
jgi:hypothetical protein